MQCCIFFLPIDKYMKEQQDPKFDRKSKNTLH